MRRLFAGGGTGAQPPLSNRASAAVLAALLLLGFALRVFMFGAVPAGLHQDEMSTAYDAFAIANYGVDRHGFNYPALMPAWGNGQSALAVYLSMPFVKIFGLNVYTARLAQLIFALVSLPLVYWAGRRIAGRGFALCALFIIAICPWHIMLSRWGIEINFLPGVLLIAFCLLLKAIENRRMLPAAAVAFALALYAYGAAYLFVPLFVLFTLAYCWRRKLSVFAGGAGVMVCVAVLAGAVIAAPIALAVLVNIFNWDSIQTALFSAPQTPISSNFMQASVVFHDGIFALLGESLARIFNLLWTPAQYNWFVYPQHGYLFPFAPLLWLPGLLLLAHYAWRSKNHPAAFMLFWFAAAFITVLAMHPPHFHRMNVLLFPAVFGAAYSLYFLYKKWKPAGLICAALLLFLFAGFAQDYFAGDPPSARVGMGDAIVYAHSNTPPGEVIRVVDTNQSYIAVLFHLEYDPREFVKTAAIHNQGRQYHFVESFGRWRFGVDETHVDPHETLIVRNAQIPAIANTAGGDAFAVKQFADFSVLMPK